MTDTSEPTSTPQALSATAVIQKQAAQQLKRRGPGKAKGSNKKSSLWSTIAAQIITHPDRPQFKCSVCSVIRSINKSYSNSNILLHYKTHHYGLFTKLQHFLSTNQPESIIQNEIQKARKKFFISPNTTSFASFYGGSSTTNVHEAVPPKTVQSVSLILFSCCQELPLSGIGSPEFQGLVDILGGRVKFASKQLLESHLIATYKAVCNVLQRWVRKARTGSLTFDGWSAALGAPIMGVTWHYIDVDWRLCSVPITTLNLLDLPKNSQQLCSVLHGIVSSNAVVGSDEICISTVTSDNEPATAQAVDEFTNYVGAVRCVVHTLALVVNDVFKPETPWQNFMDHVNKVTSFFNYHPKANMLLREKQLNGGVTADRIQQLKHDVPTWQSRLAAMTVYLTRSENIAGVANDLSITNADLPLLSNEQMNFLVEIVAVLKEVRRVARQLEADRYVSMSRAPRLLHELYETLQILSGQLVPHANQFHDIQSHSLAGGLSDLEPTARPTISSIAVSDAGRDRARQIRLVKPAARALSSKLCESLDSRLGQLWCPVDSAAVFWDPLISGSTTLGSVESSYAKGRRVLLFHLAAVLDVNECELEFIGHSQQDRDDYFALLYSALVREVLVLDESVTLSSSSLETLYSLFHRQMRDTLKAQKRREPNEALAFWKSANQTAGLVSPVPFNTVARALFASQASSAAAERLFSDLGRREGSQSQSLLSSTSEMVQVIRMFVKNELYTNDDVQVGLLHPKGQIFERLALRIASMVHNALDGSIP